MLQLSPEESDLVVAEASAAARVLEGSRQEQALDIAREAGSGELPDNLVTALEGILTASLQGGPPVTSHKAEGERLLTRVLSRTPGGKRLQEDLDAVNQALRSLAGRNLEQVRVAMRTPGHFTVSVQTEGVGVVLVVRPDGVAVESLTA